MSGAPSGSSELPINHLGLALALLRRSLSAAELAALGAILAGAAALRIVGSGSGLPLPLLNPDETNIVPRAWDVVHGGGLDPGWYDYPSLIFLALAPTQIAAPHAPMPRKSRR